MRICARTPATWLPSCLEFAGSAGFYCRRVGIILDCYPAAGGRTTKLGLKPYWGTARPKPGPPVPKGTGGMLPAIAVSGAIMGVPPSVEASGLASGEAPTQLGGTDSVPTAPALPKAADIALPRPPVPSGPVTAGAIA